MRQSAGRRQCWRHARIRFEPRLTADTRPDDVQWLRTLVRRSPVLADAAVRRHWLKLVPWLSTDNRYTLAAILLDIENACMR
jgi:hypothetical protein